MRFVKHLRCIECGATFPAAPDATTCPACGPAAGILDVIFDYEAIERHWHPRAVDRSPDPSHWRFLPLLPVEPEARRPGLRTGGTPLLEVPTAAEALGVRRLWLKDEGVNPTGSLKDRASAVGVVKALEAGATVIACASTGNAASSLAGQAASVGMKTAIFVPDYTAQGKVAQLLMFGANVFSVTGSYTQAYDLCAEAVARYGWYNRSCAVNPYLVEGKKTAGLEIAQQLGWDAPDWLVVSVGDGCTMAGVYKGFTDLHRLGWIRRVPRLLAVQAEGSRAIYEYHRTGQLKAAGEATIAGGIAVSVPRNARKAVRAITSSGGTTILVSDDEIRAAMRWTGRLTGVFAEPAAAAAVAGLRRAVAAGLIGHGETVAAVISGSGLKDIKNAIDAAGSPHSVTPDVEALAAVLPPDLVWQ